MTDVEASPFLAARRARLQHMATNRAAVGAAWLDKQEPGWWTADRINLVTLRMSSCTDCLLGQLYGGYEQAPLFADLPADFDDDYGRLAAPYGFDLTHSDHEPSWIQLTDAWVHLIRARRAAAGQPDPATT